MTLDVEVDTVAVGRAIAAHGLGPSPDVVRLDAPAWIRVLRTVADQRMSGLAVASAASGWLDLTDDQQRELLDLHRGAMAWCLTVERKLVELARTFDEEEIRYAVLKGPSVAHAAYTDPSLRSFGDLDLLVRTEDYERTCGMLGRLGHVRQRPEPRKGFEVRFGKASVHKHVDDGIEVDLHRTLVIGPFGLWIRPEELMQRATGFRIGGVIIQRLDDTGMLLNVAMHASLGWRPPRLVPLRDVMQVSAGGRVDWNVVGGWVREWRLAAVLRHAFETTAEVLRIEPPEPARAVLGLTPTRGEARALIAYTGDGRRDGGPALATFRAIPGIRSKAAYAAALAFPEREFLTARTGRGRRPSYLRRLRIPVRWMRTRL